MVCSGQNIDRVVAIYRAAKATGRELIVDAYGAEVLKATGYRSIPKPADDWDDVKVFIPQRQRAFLKQSGIAAIVDAYKGRRIWPEQLRDRARKAVFLIRPWMVRELERRDALNGAVVIWSQWDGYLQQESGAQFKAECEERGLPFEVIHTSGHASPVDLKRLAEAISPKRLAAIHTFARSHFPSFFQNVIMIDDGQWAEV